MTGWTAIEMERPDMPGRYLVYTDNGTVELAEWDGHIWTWYSDDVSLESRYTYWMELPAPPVA